MSLNLLSSDRDIDGPRESEYDFLLISPKAKFMITDNFGIGLYGRFGNSKSTSSSTSKGTFTGGGLYSDYYIPISDEKFYVKTGLSLGFDKSEYKNQNTGRIDKTQDKNGNLKVGVVYASTSRINIGMELARLFFYFFRIYR